MPSNFIILTEENPALRKKSTEIEPEKISSKIIQELCFEMPKLMKKKEGAGLAAPQIGKNIRLITINTKDGPVCLINPEITKRSWAKEWDCEGCLSVPGVYGEVKRHKKIHCSYFDKAGKKTEMPAQGLMARVIQHEIDHLDGILFIDKAKNIKKEKGE